MFQEPASTPTQARQILDLARAYALQHNGMPSSAPAFYTVVRRVVKSKSDPARPLPMSTFTLIWRRLVANGSIVVDPNARAIAVAGLRLVAVEDYAVPRTQIQRLAMLIRAYAVTHGGIPAALVLYKRDIRAKLPLVADPSRPISRSTFRAYWYALIESGELRIDHQTGAASIAGLKMVEVDPDKAETIERAAGGQSNVRPADKPKFGM